MLPNTELTIYIIKMVTNIETTKDYSISITSTNCQETERVINTLKSNTMKLIYSTEH